ncbi:uncharacterized protein LOC110084840 [Pogona vitticeps]
MAQAWDLPSFQRLSQDSSVFGSPAAMELSTGSDPFSPPPSAPGIRAGSAFPFSSGGGAAFSSGIPGSPGTSPFSSPPGSASPLQGGPVPYSPAAWSSTVGSLSPASTPGSANPLLGGPFPFSPVAWSSPVGSLSTASPQGSASPLLGGPFPYSPVAWSSTVGSLSPASTPGSANPLLGGPFPYSPAALSSTVGSLSTASPLSGGPFSFPSGSPGTSPGTYSSSSSSSGGGGGGGGAPLDGSQQLWWDPVGGLAAVPDYYYSQVGGGGGPSPSPADGATGGSADGAAAPSPGALVPAFPGSRPRPGPLMLPPQGVFSPPNYPALRVSPGRGQPFFTFPTSMGVAPAPSAPLVGATAMPQKLTEGKPREQRAHATSLSSTKSPKDTRQVTLERIVGEIAFQLDRRILSSIFPDRIRLYGYTVGNIPEKIAQGGNDPLSPLTPEQRASMMEHYNAIMTRLKPQGYDPAFHPQFTEHIVNTYGILRERPDTAGSEKDTYNDPAYLREVIENVVPVEKRADCLVLLVCLQMLSKADGKPLFIW